jgi:hypothetical protein
VAFQGINRFGTAFPLKPQGILVLFEAAVNGGGAYRFEFFRDFLGDTEGWAM